VISGSFNDPDDFVKSVSMGNGSAFVQTFRHGTVHFKQYEGLADFIKRFSDLEKMSLFFQ